MLACVCNSPCVMTTKSLNTAPSESNVIYAYDQVTTAQAAKVPSGTVAHQEHSLGLRMGEPLIIAMDAMIKYARAHEIAFESKLAEDYVLGPEWLETVKGIRGLLNGNGAVANEKPNYSRDSKDNGAVEGMFWAALEIAGYTEETANL